MGTYSEISVIETNEYVGIRAGPSCARQKPLVDRLDLERIRVHQHQAEVGFVAADDAGLQSLRAAFARRIENRDQLLAADAQLIGAEVGDDAAVKAVIQDASSATLRPAPG